MGALSRLELRRECRCGNLILSGAAPAPERPGGQAALYLAGPDVTRGRFT